MVELAVGVQQGTALPDLDAMDTEVLAGGAGGPPAADVDVDVCAGAAEVTDTAALLGGLDGLTRLVLSGR